MWLALTLTLILGEGVNYLTLRVQFYANECNEEQTLTPNPNECNSTLTSGTNNIYTYLHIDVNDRVYRLRITHTLHRPGPIRSGYVRQGHRRDVSCNYASKKHSHVQDNNYK